MSVGANAIGQMPIATDQPATTSKSTTPPNRTITPQADAVVQPEAR